jgi:DNA polymerase-3 subunit alpha
VESFIKSGAFDGFMLTRKQMMLVYADIMDSVSQERKSSVEGQMSLFDMFEADDRPSEIVVPNVGEFTKEELLTMEKEVLGAYISGHPIDEYRELWTKNITNMTSDFENDEESEEMKVNDGGHAIVGGIISDIKLKMTKSGQQMAFVTIEDLVGTVEVIVFPKAYAAARSQIVLDSKVFVIGTVDAKGDENAKILCNKVIAFDSIPRDVWIKFSDKQAYIDNEKKLYSMIATSDGNDRVIVYCEAEKAKKYLPMSMTIRADENILECLKDEFGIQNVKVVEKTIEK